MCVGALTIEQKQYSSYLLHRARISHFSHLSQVYKIKIQKGINT